ncbi:MAG: 3-hydroxyacyl-CoA dehydrogenase family protein [Thermoleophilia bacterium]
MAAERIAVIGAGLMGHGIAQVFACAGHDVSVQDPFPEALASLRERVAANLRLLGLPEAAVEHITPCREVADAVAEATFIFEAAPEDVALKQDLMARITTCAAPSAVIASNTSSMPVATYAETARGRERVVGAHWWNPPYLIPLVEVVQGVETSPATVEATMALLSAAGKLPVLVRKDVPGFIANRLQHALWREAIALVQNGICDAETVDLCIRNSFGLRLPVMGPLETADLVGLDMILSIHEQILPYIDRTPGPLQILVDKVEAGDLGMKSGRGFREWTPDEAAAARRRLTDHLIAALVTGATGSGAAADGQ